MQHGARERGGIGGGERRGHAAHGEGRGSQCGHREAECRERVRVLFRGGDLEGLRRERGGYEQRLHRKVRVLCGLQPLVDDALVRRVHVHEHEAAAVLCEDVDAVELREGEAERMRIVGVPRGGRWRLGVARAEESGVERGGLGGVDGERGLCGHRSIRALVAAGPRPARGAAEAAIAAAVRHAGAVATPARGRTGSLCAAAPSHARRRQLRRCDPELVRRGHGRLLRRRGGQRLLHRAPHELVYPTRIAEAYFRLLRMHVHIHAPRIDREPQRIRRLPVVVQHVAIGLAQCMREHAIAHEASVDEDVLSAALRGIRGAHREAADPRVTGRHVHARRVRHEVVAQDRLHTRLPSALLQAVHGAAVVVQREAHVRMRERDAAEGLVAVTPFGGIGAQELASRGRVEEELLHGHARAGRECCRRDGRDRPALNLDAPSVRLAHGARGERHTRDRRDRRQCLAAKTQCRDAFEVGGRAELGRGMPRQRERQLLARDAATVVHHADALHAAAGDVDLDLRRAGIERVLEQLLQHRARPLDDLAGGDLADQEIRQRLDRRHQRGTISARDCATSVRRCHRSPRPAPRGARRDRF